MGEDQASYGDGYSSQSGASEESIKQQLSVFFENKLADSIADEYINRVEDVAVAYGKSSSEARLSAYISDPYQAHYLSSFQYTKLPYLLIKSGLALTNADYQGIMGHSWASIRTRSDEDMVSKEHSEKLVHQSYVLLKGLEIFGKEDALNCWLRKYNPFLEAIPLALLQTIRGTELVLEEMDRLLEGNLA